MILWHMVSDSRVLTFATVKSLVRGYTFLFVEDFNSFSCYPNIDFMPDVFVRDGV